jgi:hypothetical protein
MQPKPLNTPQPLQVQALETPDGPSPRRILWRGRWRAVVGVDDVWQIDDEWWRAEISRRYFLVRLDGDVPMTLFYDWIGKSWWWQRG